MMTNSRKSIAAGIAKCLLLVSVWGCGQNPVEGPTPPRPGPTIHRPTGIDPSGTTDVSQELLAFFASVPDGSTIELPADATYRVEGPLLFEGREGLTINGNGALLFATTDGSGVIPPEALKHRWPRKRAHLIFHGGSDIVVRNLRIRGAHPNAGTNGDYIAELEGQHGIVLRGVQGVEIDRVTINDVYGDFIYLGGHKGVWTRHAHIHDSHFERSGRQGFAITGAEDVLFEDSYMGEVKRTALDIEPNGDAGGAKKLTVRNNTFGPIHGHWLAGHGKVGIVEDIVLENNILHAKMKVSTNEEGRRRQNFRIVGNVSDYPAGSPAPLMALHLIDGLEVRGNVHPLNQRREMTGVYVTRSCEVEIAENQFVGAAKEYEIEPFEGC